jgi:hypothetical protein
MGGSAQMPNWHARWRSGYLNKKSAGLCRLRPVGKKTEKWLPGRCFRAQAREWFDPSGKPSTYRQ